MPSSPVTAKSTSDTRSTEDIRPPAPEKAPGQAVVGLSRQTMQRRLGNRGVTRAIQQLSGGRRDERDPAAGAGSGEQASADTDIDFDIDIDTEADVDTDDSGQQAIASGHDRIGQQAVADTERRSDQQAAADGGPRDQQDQARSEGEGAGDQEAVDDSGSGGERSRAGGDGGPGRSGGAGDLRTDGFGAGGVVIGETPDDGQLDGDGQRQPEAAAATEDQGEMSVLSPGEATAPARRGVGRAARRSRRHPDPRKPVEAAKRAAVDANRWQARGAAQRTVTRIDAVPEGKVPQKEKATFRTELEAALKKEIPIPKNDDEAERIMDEGGRKASASLSGAVGGMTRSAGGKLVDAASDEREVSPGEVEAPQESELKPEAVGDAPSVVSGRSVVPPPLPDAQLDYSDHSADSDRAMADNAVTEEQLARGNEPEFDATLGARFEAEAQATEGATELRQREAGVRADGRGRADQSIADGLSGFHATRNREISGVAGTQGSTRSQVDAERRRITTRVVAIKNKARQDVNRLLTEMSEGAKRIFADGLTRAEKAYEKYFDDNVGGLSVFGLFRIGGDTARAFRAASAAYEREVDKAITMVVAHVESKLADAKKRAQQGKAEVDDFVRGLDEDVARYGREAQRSVATDFETLENDIEASKSGLIDSLVSQYRDSQERVAAMEERLRSENMSLWDRVYEATVGLVKKILEFKNLLLNVLARAGEVIGAIIDDPIGFLGNLIDGILGGIRRFKDNIAEHLKTGLMGWLVGSLEGAGIELPTTFDLKGIFQLIFGILGVTYRFIRRKAVRLLGEAMVSRLEQVAEIFIVLVKEGPAGVWRMFVEQLGDIKEMILGQIREFVITKIIVAGVTWLVSLLNPVSAFFKACKAIYDIVMFFVTRGRQIMDLVNAIIDSIAAIVAGNVAAMSKAVENALARILPVAISFLASLLGLSGISGKIRKIVGKIQAKVEKAVDWIVAKAVALARKAGRLFGRRGPADDRGDEPKYDDQEKQAKVTAARADIDRQESKRAKGDITRDEAEAIAQGVKRQHPVLKAVEVRRSGEFWAYQYRASEQQQKIGQQKAATDDAPDWVVVEGDYWRPKERAEITFKISKDHQEAGLQAQWHRQLGRQQAGLNDMTLDTWKANIKRFASKTERRDVKAESAKFRRSSRSEMMRRIMTKQVAKIAAANPKMSASLITAEAHGRAKKILRGLAVLHNPDAVAGGAPDQSDAMARLGSSRVNSAIGGSWPYRVEKIRIWVEKMTNRLRDEDLSDATGRTKLNILLTAVEA